MCGGLWFVCTGIGHERKKQCCAGKPDGRVPGRTGCRAPGTNNYPQSREEKSDNSKNKGNERIDSGLKTVERFGSIQGGFRQLVVGFRLIACKRLLKFIYLVLY